MNAQHTPGRLYIRTNRHPNTDGTPWGWVDLYEAGSMRQASPEGMQITWSRGQTSEANARRLVACWNACEGLSTEALEREPLIAAFEREQGRADAAEIQRDELLAAAMLVIAWFEAEDDHSKADFYQRMEMCRESEAALRAAIAKVKGGAA